MVSLRKKRQLRRLRAEEETRRFMMNLFRWVEAAKRFDQSHEPAGLPIAELNSMLPVPNSCTSDDPG
jgi:hypothetical protein